MAFYACYLLTPARKPHRMRCTYVGFTVAPTRRIRQHNGELVNGAKRTTKYRPWCIHVMVHPYVSLATRDRLLSLKGVKGLGQPYAVKRKIAQLHEIVHVGPWKESHLTISYTSKYFYEIARSTGYFQWPAQMECEIKPLGDFATISGQCYLPGGEGDDDNMARCFVCEENLYCPGENTLRCYHEGCSMECHSLCLADHFSSSIGAAELGRGNGDRRRVALPLGLHSEQGNCPECQQDLVWTLLVQHTRRKRRRRLEKKNKQSKKKDNNDTDLGDENRDGQLDTEYGSSDKDLMMNIHNNCKRRDTSHKPMHKAEMELSINVDSCASSLSSDQFDYADDGWFEDDGYGDTDKEADRSYMGTNAKRNDGYIIGSDSELVVENDGLLMSEHPRTYSETQSSNDVKIIDLTFDEV